MALRNALILRKPRSGCLEGRKVLVQPIGNSFTTSEERPGGAEARLEARTARAAAGSCPALVPTADLCQRDCFPPGTAR